MTLSKILNLYVKWIKAQITVIYGPVQEMHDFSRLLNVVISIVITTMPVTWEKVLK